MEVLQLSASANLGNLLFFAYPYDIYTDKKTEESSKGGQWQKIYFEES